MARALTDARAEARRERQARTTAFEQLRQADRLSTAAHLLSGLAHELGTPLNVVSGRAMMIASGECTTDEALSNARAIVQQAQNMTSIIQRLLEAARRSPLARERVPLREVVEWAVELVEPLAEQAEVTMSFTGDEVTATVDRDRVLQVVTNLLTRAVRALPGGTVEIRLSEARVDSPPERRSLPGDYACITVTDQGQPLDPTELAHIFDPLSTTDKDLAAGLGLSVCQAIVRDHGGWIHPESHKGGGTTFSVYLPQESRE